MFVEYHTANGAIYKIKEERMARGGEGSIHEIENMPNFVAKIFRKNKCSSAREEKIGKMVLNKAPEGVLRCVAWPLDVLYGENGFAGYVMKRVKCSASLSELYSDSKYDLLVRTYAAYNLCAAVEEIHNMGQVCGDLNPRNICINLDRKDRDVYKVTLVDTDSYHFIADESVYRCEVGLAEYLAPELQQKISGEVTLKNAPLPTFTRETDLFALAVHVFCLLMNGSHPFACAKKNGTIFSNTMEQMAETRESVVAPQPIENIKSGFFPFYIRRMNVDIPAYAPEFESLEPTLQELFVQTFVEGYKNPKRRVQADKWVAVLGTVIESFNEKTVRCPEEHIYFKHMTECPFCEIQKKMESIMGEDIDVSIEPPVPPEEIRKPVVVFLCILAGILLLLIMVAMINYPLN